MRDFLTILRDKTVTWLKSISIPHLTAAISIIISVAALLQSCEATEMVRTTAYQATQAELRTQSYRIYAEASQNYQTYVDEVYLDLHLKFDDPQIVKTFNQKDLYELSQVAKGSFREYRRYTTMANKSRGLWSAELEGVIEQAGADANAVARCYLSIGDYPAYIWNTEAKNWQSQNFARNRIAMAQNCQNISEKIANLRDAHRNVAWRMRNEQREAWQMELLDEEGNASYEKDTLDRIGP